MSSFRFILKQQWTIEEISILSNSSHLEWRAGLSDTILKGTHPRTISARFGLIWFRGFRGEDLNVKVYAVRQQTPSDGKSSHGLWPGELKRDWTTLKVHNWNLYNEPLRNVDHYKNKLYYRNIIGRPSIKSIAGKIVWVYECKIIRKQFVKDQKRCTN